MGENRPTVLITGCSTGIGRATALYLAGRGWQVYATARRPETIADLASTTVTPLILDVTRHETCVTAVQTVLEQRGRIDALINNAAFGVFGVLEEVPLSEVMLQLETNVVGTLRMCQLVLPAMRAQRNGRIVNISSVAGRIGFPIAGAYNASKAALHSLNDALRVEVRPWNIKVVSVELGVVKSEWVNTAVRRAQEVLENPDSPYVRLLEYYQRQVPAMQSDHVPPPEKVAHLVYRVLAARHPAPRYIGPSWYWAALTMLLTALPLSWRDALLAWEFWGQGQS